MDFHAYWRRYGMFKISHAAARVPYAAFVLPLVLKIVNDAREPTLYVAVRNTPIFKGMYSVIGGKVDRDPDADRPAKISDDMSQSSFDLVSEGWERPSFAAAREFWEEMYDKPFPEQMIESLSSRRIVRADDENSGVSCYVRMLLLPPTPFTPSPREIGEVKPLRDVPARHLNPLTQVVIRAMYELKDKDGTRTFEGYHDQLPKLEDLTVSCDGPNDGNHYVFGYDIDDSFSTHVLL